MGVKRLLTPFSSFYAANDPGQLMMVIEILHAFVDDDNSCRRLLFACQETRQRQVIIELLQALLSNDQYQLTPTEDSKGSCGWA